MEFQRYLPWPDPEGPPINYRLRGGILPTRSAWYKYKLSRSVCTLGVMAFWCAAAADGQVATVNVYPGTDIPSVVNAYPAGTTFVIQPGIYRLRTPIVAKDGDTFIGQMACAPPQTPCPAILNGSELLISFHGSGLLYYVTGQTQQNRVSVTNIWCQTGYLGCIYPEDLYFDDVPQTHMTTLADVGPGTWYFDYPNATIYFHTNPAGHKVETSVVPSAFDLGPANNVTIKGLTLEKFATPILTGAVGGSSSGGSPTTGANWVIENNEIRLNHANGVTVNFGWLVLNNYLHDNGDFGCCGGVGGGNPDGSGTLPSRVIVQGNEIAHNNYAHVRFPFGAGGSKIARSNGPIFRGNYVHDNMGPGLWTDISTHDALFDNNTIADNPTEGLFHETSFGTTVMRNNKLLRNGYTHPASVSGGYASNLESSTSQGVEAYCNTIEVSAQGGNAMTIIASNRGNDVNPPYARYISSGNHFHHNTVVWDSNGNAGAVGGVNYDPTNQPNFYTLNSFDDNTYHLPSLSLPFFHWGDTRSKTFVQFQAAGQDTHGAADTNYTSSVPTVVITSPVDESTVSGTVGITGNAQDKNSINKVEFYVDWSLHSTEAGSTFPFNFTWNTSGASAGPHTVAAMAYNSAGIRACYAVTLNVP
jgi:hypothetical protein